MASLSTSQPLAKWLYFSEISETIINYQLLDLINVLSYQKKNADYYLCKNGQKK